MFFALEYFIINSIISFQLYLFYSYNISSFSIYLNTMLILLFSMICILSLAIYLLPYSLKLINIHKLRCGVKGIINFIILIKFSVKILVIISSLMSLKSIYKLRKIEQ